MSGPQCCDNPPALSSTSGVGSVIQLAGFNTYVSGSSNSKVAILLVSDIFGYEAPNLRKLADKVAAVGYFVVVPDFLYGDPFSFENTDKPLSVWIQSHGTDKGFGDAKQVVAALKDKGLTAIGAAGFCWGAKVVVELAKSDNIQAAVLLHPSFVTVDDIKDVKAPIAVLGAEIDQMSPPELIKQFGEILSSKPEVDSFVKIFPELPMGGVLDTMRKTRRLCRVLKKPIGTCWNGLPSMSSECKEPKPLANFLVTSLKLCHHNMVMELIIETHVLRLLFEE